MRRRGWRFAPDGSLAIADTATTPSACCGQHRQYARRQRRNERLVDATGSAALSTRRRVSPSTRPANLYVADTATRYSQDPSAASSRPVAGLSAPRASRSILPERSTLRYRQPPYQDLFHDRRLRTLAASAGRGGSADGTGSAAGFSGPAGLAVAPDGTIYVTDTATTRPRRDDAGAVTTVGGSAGATGRTAEWVRPRVHGPEAVAVDPRGSIYAPTRRTALCALASSAPPSRPSLPPIRSADRAAVTTTVQFTCSATTGNPAAPMNGSARTRLARRLLYGRQRRDLLRRQHANAHDYQPGRGDEWNPYRCRAFNSAGSVTSSPATLTMQGPSARRQPAGVWRHRRRRRVGIRSITIPGPSASAGRAPVHRVSVSADKPWCITMQRRGRRGAFTVTVTDPGDAFGAAATSDRAPGCSRRRPRNESDDSDRVRQVPLE